MDNIECTQAPGMSSSPIEKGVSVSCKSVDLIECTFTNTNVRNVPTLNEWGLITVAFILGLIGLFAVRKRIVVS